MESSNISEGLKTARALRPSVIFLDLNLPDLNGFEILERLKSEQSTTEIPVIIHDNGSGISRETIEKIFQPFYSTKREKGTGLGLSVIRNLITKYRGTISVHSTSTPLRCTSFSVFLPTDAGLERKPKVWVESHVERLQAIS